MKSSTLLSFIIFFGFSSVAAQADSVSSKVTYFNAIHAGGLLGKKGNGSSLSASTIHGITLKNFALGIGVGYDAYLEWRTLPVFGSLGYDFASIGENSLFVQLNAGYSKAWYPLADEVQFIYHNRGGWLVHPLVGYAIRSDTFILFLTAGYKVQQIEYEQTPRWWVSNSKVIVHRDIERVSVQLGFGFL